MGPVVGVMGVLGRVGCVLRDSLKRRALPPWSPNPEPSPSLPYTPPALLFQSLTLAGPTAAPHRTALQVH